MPHEQSEYFEAMAAQQQQHHQPHYAPMRTVEPMPLVHPPQQQQQQAEEIERPVPAGAPLYPVIAEDPEVFCVKYDPFMRAYFTPASWAIIFDTLIEKLRGELATELFFDNPKVKVVGMTTGLFLVHSSESRDLLGVIGKALAVYSFLSLARGESASVRAWNKVMTIAREAYYEALTFDSNDSQAVVECNDKMRQAVVQIYATSPDAQKLIEVMAGDRKLLNVGAVLWAPSTMRHFAAHYKNDSSNNLPVPKPKPKPKPQPARTPTVPFHCSPASWHQDMNQRN